MRVFSLTMVFSHFEFSEFFLSYLISNISVLLILVNMLFSIYLHVNDLKPTNSMNTFPYRKSIRFMTNPTGP